MTDRAGVRVVSLFKDDLLEIEEIIKDEFDVKEKVDKLDEKGIDQFGYGTIHFILQLGEKVRGARYDDLRELKCEIQTRTVLQDAWAIIQQNLEYKQVGVPDDLARRINALAGSLETADNEFQSIARALKDKRESTLHPSERNCRATRGHSWKHRSTRIVSLNTYVGNFLISRWSFTTRRLLRLQTTLTKLCLPNSKISMRVSTGPRSSGQKCECEMVRGGLRTMPFRHLRNSSGRSPLMMKGFALIPICPHGPEKLSRRLRLNES